MAINDTTQVNLPKWNWVLANLSAWMIKRQRKDYIPMKLLPSPLNLDY
jgi:hypothetical protein